MRSYPKGHRREELETRRVFANTLLQLPSSGNRPDHLDLILPDAHNPLKQVADNTAMVGDHRHPLADFRFTLTPREIRVAVLFRLLDGDPDA